MPVIMWYLLIFINPHVMGVDVIIIGGIPFNTKYMVLCGTKSVCVMQASNDVKIVVIHSIPVVPCVTLYMYLYK